MLEKLEDNLKKIEDDVKLQLIDRRFSEAFDRFYDKDETKFLAVSNDILNQKKEYIKSVYYNFNKRELEEKKTELEKTRNRKAHLENVMNEAGTVSKSS